jgi:hypothetical protein
LLEQARSHADEIQRQLNELQRWHKVTLDREDRVQALKREVNELLVRLDEPIRYHTGREVQAAHTGLQSHQRTKNVESTSES